MTMGKIEVIMVAIVIERTLVSLPCATALIAPVLAPAAAIRSAKLASLMMPNSTEVMGFRFCSVM